jgi:hypothetical protein
MTKFITHLRTELFISTRLNFLAIAFPVVQIWTMQFWPQDITIKEAITYTMINYFIINLFSLPIGIYRQYLKK